MNKTQLYKLPESPDFTTLREKTMTENQAEIWKDVPGFNGYQASNFGNIKKGVKVLNKTQNGFGYDMVCLYDGSRWRGSSVHRLVMLAFCGASELHVDHLNGIKTDNRLINLEYVTSRENSIRHYRKVRSMPVGVRPAKKKFKAIIRYKKILIHIGQFDTINEAEAAYCYVLEIIKNCPTTTTVDNILHYISISNLVNRQTKIKLDVYNRIMESCRDGYKKTIDVYREVRCEFPELTRFQLYAAVQKLKREGRLKHTGIHNELMITIITPKAE